jgi:hypothetical protein
MIQLGRINKRFYKKFMQVISTLHVNLTFMTIPQKFITKIK